MVGMNKNPLGTRISARVLDVTKLTLVATALMAWAAGPARAVSCSNPFGAPAGYPTGAGAVSVVVGDFNNDGKLDLAVSNNSGNSVSVLLGNGDGTFQAPITTSVTTPGGLAVGDFNHDGRLDLAVTNTGASTQFGFTGNTVTVLLGNGNGTFTASGSYSVGSGPTSIVAADFNGDGNLDLAVASTTGGTVTFLEGYGNGTFATASSYSIPNSDNTNSLAVGDFNGDGRPDLVVTNGTGLHASGSVTILLNSGNFSFSQSPISAVQGTAYAVAIADFNHDGVLDLAVTDASQNQVSVLLGQGNGNFARTTGFSTPALNPIAVAAADLNGDASADLVEANASGALNIGLAFGDGTGAFPCGASLSAGTSTSTFQAVAVGDFNGDGKPDLAVAAFNDGGVYVMLQTGGSGNTPAGSNVSVQPVDSTTNSAPVMLTFSDVTQAGNTTLTTSASGPAPPSGFQLGSPSLYYDLATTAAYSGPIEICINYSGVSFTNLSQLSIWHYSGGFWSELSTSINTASTTVCASTPSLSPFAILQPLDSTPPVITPTVTGTLGLNGWYVSNVSVSWSVTDPESGVASSSGCTPVTLSSNTAGTTLTCSATNGVGLSSSYPITIQIDQSAPNPPLAALSPPANGAGWNNSATTVSFLPNGDVGPSGVASCTGSVTVSTETAGTTETGVCVSFAGNTSLPTMVTVRIDETAPAVSKVSVNPDPVAINTGTTLSATLTDSGSVVSGVASAEYSVNGGASNPMTGTFGQATVNATATLPALTATGVYNVCVGGADVAGNSGAASCIPLPVYDPTGGFATGGGSIASPPGADLANPNTGGLATFGFVSKYLPGANTPSGNLEFQFTAGNLNFKSTSMDWLVVTGEPRAQFHGTGTINNGTVCQFQVDAWDHSFQPGNLDAFGIKIYSCDNGQDRYSVPPTSLASGSIIIHRQ